MKNHNLYILKIFLLFFIASLAGCGDHCSDPKDDIELTIEVDAVACARENLTTTYQIICYSESEFSNDTHSIESQSTRDIIMYHDEIFEHPDKMFCVLKTENQTEYREDIALPSYWDCTETIYRNISFVLDVESCVVE